MTTRRPTTATTNSPPAEAAAEDRALHMLSMLKASTMISVAKDILDAIVDVEQQMTQVTTRDDLLVLEKELLTAKWALNMLERAQKEVQDIHKKD